MTVRSGIKSFEKPSTIFGRHRREPSKDPCSSEKRKFQQPAKASRLVRLVLLRSAKLLNEWLQKETTSRVTKRFAGHRRMTLPTCPTGTWVRIATGRSDNLSFHSDRIDQVPRTPPTPSEPACGPCVHSLAFSDAGKRRLPVRRVPVQVLRNARVDEAIAHGPNPTPDVIP